MCGSQSGFNDACCPQGQVFQEEICGNFNGPTGAVPIWSAPVVGGSDYIQGTFEIFNSNSSSGDVTGTITIADGSTVVFAVAPGTSIARSVNRPTLFEITALTGQSGTYCITLYKRVMP